MPNIKVATPGPVMDLVHSTDPDGWDLNRQFTAMNTFAANEGYPLAVLEAMASARRARLSHPRPVPSQRW